MTISRSVTYVRRPELHAVEMDGELVMMGQQQGEYYGMRDVAALIWHSLAQPRSLDDLVALVSNEYPVTADECRADITAFLEDLVSRTLVTAS